MTNQKGDKQQSYRRATSMPSSTSSGQQQRKQPPRKLSKGKPREPDRDSQGGTPSTAKSSPKLKKCQSEDDIDMMMKRKKQQHMVDRFGFIVNTDKQKAASSNELKSLNNDSSKNNNNNMNSSSHHSRSTTPDGKVIICVDEPLTGQEAKRTERREKKWTVMMQSWDSVNKKRHKLVLNRLRKGLPDSIRGKVWKTVGNVPHKIKENPRVYQKILKKVERDSEQMGENDTDNAPPEGPNRKNSGDSMVRSQSFQNIQETIERDIHRTYPRHHLFYDDHKDDESFPGSSQLANNSASSPPTSPDADDDDDFHQSKLGSLCNEDLQSLIRDLESPTSTTSNKDDTASGKASSPTAAGKKKCSTLLDTMGGQGALRRVLRAYSYYDREVGYCQGMNFIAAMFITLMSEEEAFWLLVAVMQDSPCRMRGLFGEGMKETHKVLFVAEKLIHQFLPKLARHLDKENVHVTMYATQWLLTQYTSSFNFDLVTRVWDVFLCEGWKITYRVMLGLLTHIQPTLLKLSFEEILGFFRDLPDKVDGDVIMETSLKIPLKTKHIEKLENDFRLQQEREQR